MNLNDLPDMSDALKQVQMYEKKKLDPVGKEDGDIDNDGDKDSSDSYLLNRRKTVTKAMGKKTHLCAKMVKKEGKEYSVIPEQHTLLEDGTVTHYDITDGNVILENVPVEELEIIEEGHHEHFANYDKNLEVLGEGKYSGSKSHIQRDGTAPAPERTAAERKKDRRILAGYGKGGMEMAVDRAKKERDERRAARIKEGFSNWRTDLIEVMDEDEADKPIKEKKVNNKVKINPKLGEAIEEIGGTLIEEIEDHEFDDIVQSVYDELIEEGYSEDDVEDAIEFALTEQLNEVSDSYYDSAVKSSKAAAAKIKRAEMMKRAKGRLRFMKRKAGEVAGKLKKKAVNKAVDVAFAGAAAKDKVKSAAATAKKRVTDAPKVAKRSIKDRIKKGALAVAKRMSEDTQDLQELPIIPVAAGAAALGGAAMMLNKANKAATTHSDKAVGKPTIQGAASGMRNRNAALKKAMQQLRQSHEPEGELVEKNLSVDDQMKISQEYNRKSPEEKREANKKVMGVVKKVKREKDQRTDAQKMTDATGPRPGSRYRGD